ncbi:MAG TPA: MFS transporter, partial [Acidimicrobiales bacterium]
LLVLQKAYAVSKAAMVPTVVTGDDELVEANAKLSLISGFIGFGAAIPALVLQLIDPRITMAFAALLSLVSTLVALALPKLLVAPEGPDALERSELHSAGILLAASAMAVLRAAVGFLTFLIAFSFRRDDIATAWFGVVALAGVLGTLTGNGVGGFLRERMREERMLMVGLGLMAATGTVTAFFAGIAAASLVGFVLGYSAAFGRLGFDAIVQRDAPDANRGRAFARFETRFQLAWVAAAAVPVVIALPLGIGLFVVGIAALGALVSSVVGASRLSKGQPLPEPMWRKAVRGARQRLGREESPPSSSRPPPTP